MNDFETLMSAIRRVTLRQFLTDLLELLVIIGFMASLWMLAGMGHVLIGGAP